MVLLKNKGQQHYRNVQVFHQKESVQGNKNRDLQKIETCKEKGKLLQECRKFMLRNYIDTSSILVG